MSCYLCGEKKERIILEKPQTPVWTNSEDKFSRESYPCRLRQCRACGHVYQPVDPELVRVLAGIYESDRAQLSTPLGIGNWGKLRSKSTLEVFHKMIDVNRLNTALEIGGGNGFLLYHLKGLGFDKLVNIEPSLGRTEQKDGIMFLKEFAGSQLDLKEKFELIYSIGVFEHIQDIRDVLTFCRAHLKEDGLLFFQVPDAAPDLKSGNPALFIHQHIHYYTKQTLAGLLASFGMEIKKTACHEGGLSVVAILNDKVEYESKPENYSGFEVKLDRILDRIFPLLSDPRLIVHGACSSLNNVLSWTGVKPGFRLADNDNTKQGRAFFGRMVQPAEDIQMSEEDTVLILPVSFFEAIEAYYLDLGVKGRVRNIFTV